MTAIDALLDSQVLGYLLLAAVFAAVLYRDWCVYRYEARRLRMRAMEGTSERGEQG